MSVEPNVLRVGNSSSQSLILTIEPWGTEYPFPPHHYYEVTWQLVGKDLPEIDYQGDRILLYGTVGSTYDISGLKPQLKEEKTS